MLAGGAAIDTVDYGSSAGAVWIDLGQLLAQWGDAHRDTLNSIENVIGSASSDMLFGSVGNNQLAGGGGDDRLTGLAGADDLLGGTGADRFIFFAPSDSPLAGADRILDFSSAEGDLIDLETVDASNQLAGEQAFVFAGADTFSHLAGELRFANHRLEGDVDGDGQADFGIGVNAATLTVVDLIL